MGARVVRADSHCDGVGSGACETAVVAANEFIVLMRWLSVKSCVKISVVATSGIEQGGQMWWKLRTPGMFRALLLLALIVTVSQSCEGERKTDKPDRERHPQPKLENAIKT